MTLSLARSLAVRHSQDLDLVVLGSRGYEVMAPRRVAVSDGISVVCATPSVRGVHDVCIEELPARIQALQQALDDAEIKQRVIPLEHQLVEHRAALLAALAGRAERAGRQVLGPAGVHDHELAARRQLVCRPLDGAAGALAAVIAKDHAGSAGLVGA